VWQPSSSADERGSSLGRSSARSVPALVLLGVGLEDGRGDSLALADRIVVLRFSTTTPAG
jgi:hypothetical protein